MSMRFRLLFVIALALPILAACGEPTPPPPPPDTDVTLTVIVAGTGSVTSDPAGIDTANDAFAEKYESGTVVTLTAEGTATSEFVGFTPADACGDGSTTTTCVVTLESDTEITATFGALETFTVSIATGGDAEGRITSDIGGIDTAAGVDEATFPIGATVVLTAEATEGGFAGWAGGDCAGVKTLTCTVTIGADEAPVTAGFNDVLTLTVRTMALGDGAVEFLGDSTAGQTYDPPIWKEGWVWLDESRGLHDLGFAPFHNLTETGLRFGAIALPADANVTGATLRVTARTGQAGFPTTAPLDLTIEGELSADAVGFVQPGAEDTPFTITTRPRTEASATWTITDAWADGDVGTASVTSIVQEIVRQASWETDNAVMLFLKGGVLEDEAYRRIYSFGSGDPDTRHPTLLIDYAVMPTF